MIGRFPMSFKEQQLAENLPPREGRDIIVIKFDKSVELAACRPSSGFLEWMEIAQ